MSVISYGEVVNGILNARTNDKINLHNGYYLNEAVGYAKIDSTLRSNISVFIPSSQAQTPGESINSPDRLLILPVGAIVTRIGLRLPRIDPNTTQQFGNLPKDRTLFGTTGELVKVGYGSVFTNTDPAIAAVANAYNPDATRTVQRPVGVADVALSGLTTIAAPTPVNLLVSNAGNTAAGNGIATSGGHAFAIVQVCWYEIQPALRYEDMGFISSIKGV